MSAFLAVSELDFSYGTLQVLFGVSLAVERGECVALMGTNGAGKSTLLRVIAGLEHPKAGRVVLDGHDIGGLAAERLVRRGVVMVPGGRAVFGDMTVADNLEVAGRSAGLRGREWRERRESALSAFPGIRSCLQRSAGSLSGGQQQQLALTKALLLDPSVLLVDELSLGLAPVVVADLVESVRAMRDRGVTIVLVEQSLALADQICQRAVFMEKGEVRFDGEVADLIERDDIARAVFFGATPGTPIGKA
ncbi:MAG TPA: ABC transporter ATP-binding protein [Mycobacteriales bacterium]|nr:ABC transporter ATP-binding protein [Mycobacteriales bacterium]